jgi:hypothetical protein
MQTIVLQQLEDMILPFFINYYKSCCKYMKKRGIMSTFANKFAKTGCTSAIKASFIAFGLHRPCPLI